jgi:hypothetical protein
MTDDVFSSRKIPERSGTRRALTMKDLETAKAHGAPIFIQDTEGAQ